MSALFLIANMAGRTVAIPSEQVESVVNLGPLTPVPLASAQVRGLATLRSRVVTVIDGGSILGMPHEAPAARGVITVVDGHPYAMIVEDLDDVVSFDEKPLADGMTLEGGWEKIARGYVERDGEPVLIVNLSSLVPVPEMAAA
ncbi:hypothetical protein GCM10023219_04360 [Stakelama sediminis]|uniref:Purine-binding chemotaxis protein CheW n=1 Tax=Stakelama sediminis TaxID=463200 RepID=A0A840YUA3_9SPHN|nr:chemotaxis protein CheW [Stakelama sediminis]MBB5717150.1 purine-binding chemotaxis protein CheW [Stakelama sediminis]